MNSANPSEIGQLAPEHLADAAEDAEAAGKGQQIGDGHPPHLRHLHLEPVGQPRQRELHDAGIELPDERAGAGDADDQPRMDGEPFEGAQRRGFER